MKNWLLLIALLVSSSAWAKDYKMSKSEFLTKIDQGTITFEKSPAMTANQTIIDHLLAGFKKEFPGFKDEMFYVSYLKSDSFTYLIFYEWYDRGCIFGVTEPKKFTGASSDQARVELGIQEAKNYEKIDRKYCAKVLGIDLDKDNLSRVAGAIKIETPPKPETKRSK